MSKLTIGQSLPFVKNKQYQKAISQLTFLISDSTDQHMISTLYSNRGTLYLACGRYTEAVDDLLRSLEANHLNYPAYFNLFSIFTMRNNNIEGLKNLCCALSCLYLLRGKGSKSEADLTKAIKYAENNIEARLLKGFINMEKKKYKIALNEINWAIQIQPQNQKLYFIRQKINKLMAEEDHSKSVNRYARNNHDFERKVPQQPQNPPKLLRLECTTYDEIDELDLPAEIGKKLTEFNELYNQLNGENSSIICKDPMIHLLQKKDSERQLQNRLNKRQLVSSFTLAEQEGEVQKESNLFNKVDETQSVEGDDLPSSRYESESFEPYLMNSRSDAKSKSQSRFSETPDNHSTYTLQALQEGKSISIRVHNIQILASAQNLEKWKNIYCQFDYGSEEGKQLFNESFEADLEDEPQILHIKVFNKQVLAFNDTFLGEGYKEITMTGRIEVPIYLEKETNVSGKVFLDIKFK